MTGRQSLSDFANKISNLFGLQEQGEELVAFVANATGCKHVCLLFLDTNGEYFNVLACLPKLKTDPFATLRLRRRDPVVNYLERKLLTRDGPSNLPDANRLPERDASRNNPDKIELMMPVISRNRLIGILVLGENPSEKYSFEDYNLLQSITDQVAVSMEKEYLREQLSQQKDELSVINRSGVIVASSLDIQTIFDSFIKELKKIVGIDWAAIDLIEGGDICLRALFPEIDSAWEVGDRTPIKGTAIELLAKHGKTIVEPDILQESQFVTAESYIKLGVRSVAYLPLTTSGITIGGVIIASRQTNAYSQRQVEILEKLTAQIATAVENYRRYAEIEQQARVDGLTGLFNRRSLDEAIASEINRHSRYGGVFSLIILDLDGSLRAVNSRYGHLAGDELLKQISSVIRKAVRTSDQAFRYGGDEFVILLPNTSLDAAYNMVAERVREQISSKVIADQIPVTASLGLASWPVNGKEANEIMAAADAALYQAKSNGGNQSRRAANP